jgi:hypothetical protein
MAGKLTLQQRKSAMVMIFKELPQGESTSTVLADRRKQGRTNTGNGNTKTFVVEAFSTT